MVLTTPIIILTLIVAAIVIIIGFVFKNKSEVITFLILAGGVILTILGITMMSEGLAFKTGTTTNITLDGNNNTIETEEFIFTEDDSFASQALKTTILLMGLATILSFMFIKREQKFEEEEEEEPSNF